jgi:hypothetical protein
MLRKIVPFAVMAVLAAAPVHAGDAPKDTAQGKGRECFLTKFVEGFAAPDDKNLYVRVLARDVYHFEMFGPCMDIDWNNRIALVSRGSDWICDGMDAEVISHSPIGPQHCFVKSIKKLTPDEVKALPRRAKP